MAVGPKRWVGHLLQDVDLGSQNDPVNFQGGSDAAGPEAASPIAGPGSVLYGTSNYGGGAGLCTYGGGCGTVYELVPSGSGYSEHVVYGFQGGSDGAVPVGGVLGDETGALYGTASFRRRKRGLRVGLRRKRLWDGL